MFAANRSQYATVRTQGIRTKDEREKDTNHVAEFGMEVPLTKDLADEIQPAMARDLFGDDGQPKAEMAGVSFALSLPTQRLEFRDHPEIAPLGVVTGVTIRGVAAKKSDDGKAWLLQFTVGWVLDDSNEAAVMQLIRRIRKTGVYLRFEPMQSTLNLEAGQADAAADAAPAEGKKRGRGRPKKGKKNPEAEHQQQLAEGSDRAADDDAAGADVVDIRPGVRDDLGAGDVAQDDQPAT